jgi:hypothetical protein
VEIVRVEALLLTALTALALGVSAPAGPATAAGAAWSVDPRIRLDWEVATGRGGRPVVRGYVYNDYRRPASDVLVLVETLDASGAVISRDFGFVRGLVYPDDRAYFEAPLKTPGASYRVSVTGLDWKGGGGGM